MNARILAFALPALLPLAGCMAEQGGFPSLAPRPIEGIDISAEPPATPAAPPAADPAQAAFAADLVGKAEDGDRAFAAAVTQAEPAIRAGADQPAGSDRWTGAQVALSRLQAARSPVADALRALDERRTTADDPALDAAFTRISALDAAQATIVADLSARLMPAR